VWLTNSKLASAILSSRTFRQGKLVESEEGVVQVHILIIDDEIWASARSEMDVIVPSMDDIDDIG
jgi:hypothetical protein